MMTNIRSTLVNHKILQKLAENLDLGSFVRLSRGEHKDFVQGGKARGRILGDTFEALLGAIYLDRGLGAVELLLDQILFPKVEIIINQQLHYDPKSRLQELAQEKACVTPSYTVLDDYGPDHDRTFITGVFFGDRLVGQGAGSSKAEAQMAAAKDALLKEFQIKLNESPG